MLKLNRLYPYGLVRRVFNALLLLVLATGSAQGTGETVILALGDSLTAGYGLAPEQSFSSQLEAQLRAAGLAVRVVNGGVSGDTTSGGRARLAWALADKPDAVIVELGANDALRGVDPAVTRQNLDAILIELRQRKLPVLLAGMLAPPNLGDAYGRAFDRIFPELAAKHGVALYAFFLEGVAAEPRLNQADGMHPTAEGVAEIVRRMMPDVRRLIATTESR